MVTPNATRGDLSELRVRFRTDSAVDRRRSNAHGGRAAGWLARSGSAARSGDGGVCCRSISHEDRRDASMRSSGLCRLEETLELSLRHAIKPVGIGYEPIAVEDRDAAARRRDQSLRFQLVQRRGDPGAPHAQHHRQELMGEMKIVALQTVM